MQRGVLALVLALGASSCCFGGPFAPDIRLVAYGRVLRDDGSPAPAARVRLCANDGVSVPDVSEPATCVERRTGVDGTYELEVANVSPAGGVCLVDVLDDSGGLVFQHRIVPPRDGSDPARVEVRDVRLPSPGSHEFLEDVRLSIGAQASYACTPRALHRCVLYAGHEGSVRVWPPTDLDPRPTCDGAQGAALAVAAGAEARRAGVFADADATAIDATEPHDGLVLQCTEGRTEITPG